MKKNLLTLLIFSAIAVLTTSFGPPNCTLYPEDSDCRLACEAAEKAITFGQGRRESQEHFDVSIALCPSFAYSHYEKAVPYAKRGDMSACIKMMDKAVLHAPEEYLEHRGWYHWFFMHNYQVAIDDIDRLEEMIDFDLGPTGNGEYSLYMVRALCLKGLGKNAAALEEMETFLAKGDIYNYDYLHLGVLYLEQGELDKAAAAFKSQSDVYEWASNQYYLGRLAMIKEDWSAALDHLARAEDLYQSGVTMDNPYRHRTDRIYAIDIERALAEVDAVLD